MPFSNHQFSLRCLFWWEVPQIDCCQCLSRDQYRFVAILKNDTGKKKQKRRLVCSTSSYLHVFFSDFVCLLPSLMLGNPIFLDHEINPSKSLVMRNSLLLSRVTGVATPNSCLGKSPKILPLLRRKFGQSEPRSQEIRKRSSWEKAKASMPWSCSSREEQDTLKLRGPKHLEKKNVRMFGS